MKKKILVILIFFLFTTNPVYSKNVEKLCLSPKTSFHHKDKVFDKNNELPGSFGAATPKDAKVIAKLSRQITNPLPLSKETYAIASQNIASANGSSPHLLVYREGKKVLGYIYSTLMPQKNLVYFVQRAVSPKHHGKGIGTELQRRAMKELQEKGFTKFFSASNPKAGSLLEKDGFEILKVRDIEGIGPMMDFFLNPYENIYSLGVSKEEAVHTMVQEYFLPINVDAIISALSNFDINRLLFLHKDHFIFQWLRINNIGLTIESKRKYKDLLMRNKVITRLSQIPGAIDAIIDANGISASQNPMEMKHISWQKNGIPLPQNFNPIQEFCDQFIHIVFHSEDFFQEYERTKNTSKKDQLMKQAQIVGDILKSYIQEMRKIEGPSYYSENQQSA